MRPSGTDELSLDMRSLLHCSLREALAHRRGVAHVEEAVYDHDVRNPVDNVPTKKKKHTRRGLSDEWRLWRHTVEMYGVTVC